MVHTAQTSGTDPSGEFSHIGNTPSASVKDSF